MRGYGVLTWIMASLLGACTTPEPAPSEPPSPIGEEDPPSGDTDAPAACDPGEGVPGGNVSITLDVGGLERRFTLRLPPDFDCSPRPVVVGLHGYYGSGLGFETETAKLEPQLDARGAIGVFPDGLQMGASGWQASVTSFNDEYSHNSTGPDGATCTEDAYDYGVYDNCPDSESEDACNWGTSCADDEGFLRALIERTVDRWGGDPSRVYLTGFSQGGQTTQSLGPQLADVITAISPHHGFAANGYTTPPEGPQSLFQVWGRQDRIVDGRDRPSNDGMIYDGATETAEIWAEVQQCEATAVTYTTPYDGQFGWACEEYPNCQTGARVVTCGWDGAHVWGRRRGVDFASEAMFTFFESLSP